MNTKLLIAVVLYSTAFTGYAQPNPNPFVPLDSPTLTRGLGPSIQEMEAIGKRLVQESQFQLPTIRSYYSDNPTLGFFSHDGRTANILWVNGTKIDLRECIDQNSLKSLVSLNQHRISTGQPLPSGYVLLHPENIEEISRNASCGIFDRLKNRLK